MTSATSASNVTRHRGFSLVELLVVIGIILVLAGIAVPMLMRSYAAADKTKIRSDLNTIAICLEAYKADHGDYPRPTYPGLGVAPNYTGQGSPCLLKALVGPGGVTAPYNNARSYSAGEQVSSGATIYEAISSVPAGNAPPNATYWKTTDFALADGADGPGFRIRSGMGKVQGPYLKMDANFKVVNSSLANKDGYVILYYPASPRKPDITQNTNYVDVLATSLYNANDNLPLMTNLNLRAMLGDFSANGRIDATVATEVARSTDPFLLISPGADGVYGPTGVVLATNATQWVKNKELVNNCDDVTNFPQ